MPTHTRGWAHLVPSKVRPELSGLGVYIHVDTTGRYQSAPWTGVAGTMCAASRRDALLTGHKLRSPSRHAVAVKDTGNEISASGIG